MRTPVKFYLKSAWLLLWLFMLTVYQMDKVRALPDTAVLMSNFYLSHEWLEPLMFFSCFPASLFYAVVADSALCSSSHGCSLENEPMFWMGLFAFGTLQWFKLVPYFFRKVRITTLDLPTLTSPVINGAAALEATSHVPPSELATTPPRRQEACGQESQKQEPQGREPSFSHFDERGRTPLERVFDDSDWREDAASRRSASVSHGSESGSRLP
ncbi:MAG TPA: hypothetical protein VGB73_05185 [Pyrinomonadaceae bacterium]|jgi:hypothetical protein